MCCEAIKQTNKQTQTNKQHTQTNKQSERQPNATQRPVQFTSKLSVPRNATTTIPLPVATKPGPPTQPAHGFTNRQPEHPNTQGCLAHGAQPAYPLRPSCRRAGRRLGSHLGSSGTAHTTWRKHTRRREERGERISHTTRRFVYITFPYQLIMALWSQYAAALSVKGVTRGRIRRMRRTGRTGTSGAINHTQAAQANDCNHRRAPPHACPSLQTFCTCSKRS